MVQIKPCTVCIPFSNLKVPLSSHRLSLSGKYHMVSFLQVVRDAVEEICVRLNISDSVEIEEYTLFLRTSKYWD